jgi:hypothetical protein
VGGQIALQLCAAGMPCSLGDVEQDGMKALHPSPTGTGSGLGVLGDMESFDDGIQGLGGCHIMGQCWLGCRCA